MTQAQIPQDGIFVTAEISLTPQVELKVGIAAIQQFCLDMCTEPGCRFAMATHIDDKPGHFILWENYQDKAAIEAHFNAPHTQAFIQSGITEFVQGYQSSLMEKAQ